MNVPALYLNTNTVTFTAWIYPLGAQQEFAGLFWWNLRNGTDTANNNSAALFGWRNFGDYGIVNANVPAGPADKYPTYYVYKLLKHFARGGEQVITATSDFNGVAVYAVRDHRSHGVNLLILNKHPTAAPKVRIALHGLQIGHRAEVFQYGIPQDDAARTGIGSADVAHSTAEVDGPTFTWQPGPYSATVIQLSRAGHRDGDHCDRD